MKHDSKAPAFLTIMKSMAFNYLLRVQRLPSFSLFLLRRRHTRSPRGDHEARVSKGFFTVKEHVNRTDHAFVSCRVAIVSGYIQKKRLFKAFVMRSSIKA